MKITCDIISDLLPLYVDEVCTEDTKAAVEEHTKECEKCREILGNMSAENPIDVSEKTEVAKAKKPFKKLKLRFVFWLVFGIFCTAVIVVTMSFAGVFDKIESKFYHSVSFLVEDAEPADEWITIADYRYFDGDSNGVYTTEDYLELRGIFQRKELSCSYPNVYSAELRIIDQDGNVVVDTFEANGGTMDIKLNGLKLGEKYYVQYRSDTGGNFAFNLF